MVQRVIDMTEPATRDSVGDGDTELEAGGAVDRHINRLHNGEW